jgi:starch synthase (maltosyl-transferring)
MIIFNLFPRLAGRITQWYDHVLRAKRMHFDGIYINPIHLTGSSKSLYAVKDYYKLDPDFISEKDGWEEFKKFVVFVKEQGFQFIIDLVINHTANENSLIQEHPKWFRWEKGQIKHPGCWDNGHWVCWGDLAEVENQTGSHISDLWHYWECLINFYIDLGATGFRCDAAYKLPHNLWKFLISRTKKQNSQVIFLAETLGCSYEDTKRTAEAGFDYIFNALKYWNYNDNWCPDNYTNLRKITKSISFPESHDTRRLCEESGGNIEICKQRYLISCLFSSGIMMPLGFEWGFRQHVDVCRMQNLEWGAFNLEDYITKCNILKSKYQIFNEECLQYTISLPEDPTLVLKQISNNGSEAVLIFLNKTNQIQSYSRRLKEILSESALDISIEDSLGEITECNFTLKPFQIKVLYAI